MYYKWDHQLQQYANERDRLCQSLSIVPVILSSNNVVLRDYININKFFSRFLLLPMVSSLLILFSQPYLDDGLSNKGLNDSSLLDATGISIRESVRPSVRWSIRAMFSKIREIRVFLMINRLLLVSQ